MSPHESNLLAISPLPGDPVEKVLRRGTAAVRRMLVIRPPTFFVRRHAHFHCVDTVHQSGMHALACQYTMGDEIGRPRDLGPLSTGFEVTVAPRGNRYLVGNTDTITAKLTGKALVPVERNMGKEWIIVKPFRYCFSRGSSSMIEKDIEKRKRKEIN